jgi:hypothetical protein
MEGIAVENLQLWYEAFWYVVSGFAISSAGLAFLRFRLLPSRVESKVTEPPRFSRTDLAMGGLIVTGLVALVGLVTGLAYMELMEIDDTNISSLWYMALWCVTAGVAALCAGLACLRCRLFLTLAWIVCRMLLRAGHNRNPADSGAGIQCGGL